MQLIILNLLFLIHSVSAKHSTGVLNTNQNWVYLERFCFVSNDGMLSYIFTYPQKYEIEEIILYFDTDDQWNSAYANNKTCSQREKIVDPKNNQIIHLSPLAKHPEEQSECISFKKSGDEVWYQCLGNRSFYSRRPRWWYLALANCDSSSGLYLEYSILMTNAQPSNRWFFHFSFDEFYVLPLSILFLVIELIILIITVVFTYLLRSRNMFHPTFKVYLNSVIIDFSGLVAYWIHYDRYADNGKGFPMLKTCGMLLRQIASILFCLLLLLMAKGYTITRGKLSSLGTVKLMVFMTLYLIGHIIMLVWEIALFDPAEVTYVSESAAAYVIASLRLLAWLWCLYSSFMTVKKYPQKKIFYVAMGFLMTIWFWAGPVALVIANYVLDNWVRSEVMLAVDSAVMIYGYTVFLILTAPVAENRNFPYHTRVNQISEDNYPQHTYEVSYTTTQMPNGNGIEITEAEDRH